MRKLFILFVVAGIISGCGEKSNLCKTSTAIGKEVNIEVIQLHHQLLGVNSKSELQQLISKEPIIADYFLNSGEYPNDSIMAEVLYKRFSNLHIDTLQQEIDRVFGDMEQLSNELNSAFAMFKHYYPAIKLPKVKTVATGLNNNADLFVSDTLIVIGLDYYLGEKANYRPLGFPNYILQKYSKEYIVPSVMLLFGISPNYNASNLKDKTILADMITYGKSYYFAKAMMPCTPDSILIGYSANELEGSQRNISTIWAHFLDKELLYSQDHFLRQKYLGERPKTYDIGDDCPGRIGAWLGWEIVKQYVDKKDPTLKEIMQQYDAQQLLQEAKFRPGK